MRGICSSVYYVRNLKEAKKELMKYYKVNDFNIDLMCCLNEFNLYSDAKKKLITVSIHNSNVINGRHENLLQVDVWA